MYLFQGTESAPNLKIQVQWIQAPLLTNLEPLGPWGRVQSGEKYISVQTATVMYSASRTCTSHCYFRIF